MQSINRARSSRGVHGPAPKKKITHVDPENIMPNVVFGNPAAAMMIGPSLNQKNSKRSSGVSTPMTRQIVTKKKVKSRRTSAETVKW